MFFFSSRRRHTRWTGDWSSDVCSSDLDPASRLPVVGASGAVAAVLGAYAVTFPKAAVRTLIFLGIEILGKYARYAAARQIGRASCRERVWISVVAVYV